MSTVGDIYNFLDKVAPFNMVPEWDNSGLLVGSMENEVHKVLLSLDITNEVVQEAHELGAKLIISHHPVIFKPLSFLDAQSVPYKLATFGINAICAHINLDTCPGGVNFCLAEKLGVKNTESLIWTENLPLGLIGALEDEMSAKDFVLLVKNQLGCEGVRYTNTHKMIKKVALCGGSGGDCVQDAIKKDADAFVTGEIKHSQILAANAANLMIVAAGHYHSENIVMEPLQAILVNRFKNIKFFQTKVFTDKINYL